MFHQLVRAEVLDYGYPQNSSLDVLKMYINLGSLKVAVSSADEKKMTSMITGARDWRREGIVHKKNEVFLDVNESVNLLVSTSGAVLRNDVTGQVVMKCQLSGMPECKLGLNDKLVLDKDAGGKGAATGAGGKKKPASVELDDVQFHRCVQLGKFDADRTITFVPPDGDFELMKYRITDNVNLPFRIIPVIEEQGKTRVVMNIKAIANFSSQLFASNVALKIPVCCVYFSEEWAAYSSLKLTRNP
jgi:AP-2 complex subunit mu-1